MGVTTVLLMLKNLPENLGGIGKFVYFCPRIIKLIRTNNCQFHKLQKYEAFNDFNGNHILFKSSGRYENLLNQVAIDFPHLVR